MIPHGVPIVSVLFHEPDSENTKLVRIGEQISNLTSTDEEEPITGYLRGIQLCPHENNMNKGHIVYDNIPTYGYVAPSCAQLNAAISDFDVDILLIQDLEGEYHKIYMDNVTSIEIQKDEQKEWIEATEADLVSYINSISSDKIDVIKVDPATDTINVTVNTSDGFDIGLLDFLLGIEGLSSVTYQVGQQSYTMTIGDESTYDSFMEGVLSSMPNETNPKVNGKMNMTAENGANLVYTLNISYFNQAEEFGKIDAYLDGYTGEDATVAKTADKSYSVTTHVDVVEDLLFDVFATIATVKNLTDVKVTIGEQVTNGVDPVALKDFVNAALHFEKSWDPVTVSIEITAGDVSATYALSYVSDYSVVDAVHAIMGPVFAPVDNDQISIVEDGAEGITWNTLTLKVDPQDLTDTTGFVDALKALPHVAQVSVNMGNSGYQIIKAPFDDDKIAQIRDIIVNNAPKSVNDTQNVIFGIQPGFGDFVNPSHSEIISYGGFANSTFDPEAKVGEHGYATVQAALAAAQSGDTVTLLKDLTVNNAGIDGVASNPVIAIPVNMTFDGNNKTITADEAGWTGTNANHIVGASNVTATIKNLTIIGHANMKSGVVCFGQTGNVTLENVTAQNCGNCGVQVAGATVSATNLHTSGNAWGGVNVDKGSDGSTPHLTVGDGCTFAELAEVYTEITDQEVITAASMAKYQGYGTTLKGFIYYTSDVSRLGTIFSDDNTIVYETLADAAENDASSVKLTENLTGVTNIPVGKSIVIDGQGKTINGQIKCVATGTGNSNVTLKNMSLDGVDSGFTYGILSQNQTDEGQMECNLTLENVNISGYTSKAIYGTNIKTLNITGGKIENCAIGEMDTPNTKGDYAIDLNLCAVQGTVVVIDGVTFAGDLGQKAAIKITQRGGASDAGASDIPKNVGEADIASVTIQNCDFTASTTEVDFRIGTDNKTGAGTVNSTGNYPVSLTGNTEMVVQSAYLEGEPTLTVPQGRDAAKTETGDIALVLTPEEQVDAIMEDIPGATETSNNVYSIVTSNSSLENLAFLDEIAAIPGFTAMTVSDGVAAPVTFEAGGNMETFKTQVQALLPDSNEDPQVTLTLTVSVA